MLAIEIFIKDESILRVRVNTYYFLAKSMSIGGLHVIVMENRRRTIDSGDGTCYSWVTVSLNTLTPDMLSSYDSDVPVVKRVLALIFLLYPGECR